MFQKSEWKMGIEPSHASFNNISFTSSSETCNEMARVVLMDDLIPFSAMALFMHACLSVAEPQASGFGGDSAVLLAEKGRCVEVTGQAFDRSDGFSETLALFREDAFAQYLGPNSFQFPGDAFTLANLAGIVKSDFNTKGYNASNVVKILNNEFFNENLHFPVSNRLRLALRNVPKSVLSFSETARFLKDESLHFLSEGDIYPVQKGFVNFNLLFAKPPLWSNFESSMSANYMKVLKSTLSFLDDDERSKKLQFISGLNISAVNTTQEVPLMTLTNGMKICAPHPLNGTAQKPLVATMLTKFKKESSNHSNHNDIEIGFYEEMLEVFNGLRLELASGWENMKSTFKMNAAEVEEFRELYNEYSTTDHRNLFEDRRYDTGNSFAIVDHKRQLAIAMTATLGSPFGSLIGDKEGIFINNFNAELFRHQENTGPFMHSQEPIIIFKKEKIHTVYAGLPGVGKRSLDVPRKSNSLALSIYHDVPLEEALTAPLVWMNDKDKALYKGGIPHKYLRIFANKMRQFSSYATAKAAERKLPDEAMAVTGKRAIAYTGETERGRIMPNGL